MSRTGALPGLKANDDLTDFVVVTKYMIQHIEGVGYGAKVSKPYPGARIWTTSIENTYLYVTWVPTAMGPELPTNTTDTFHWEDES